MTKLEPVKLRNMPDKQYIIDKIKGVYGKDMRTMTQRTEMMTVYQILIDLMERIENLEKAIDELKNK